MCVYVCACVCIDVGGGMEMCGCVGHTTGDSLNGMLAY